MEYTLDTAHIHEWANMLNAGDRVLLCGTVYTARDAAHKKIVLLLQNGEKPPFELRDAVIYYAGPTPAKNGLCVGSIGPTTSSRMDNFAPVLLEKGLKGMIGKGVRSPAVIDAMKKAGAVYFAAVGGAGALYSECISSCEVVAFPELGCESVKKLTVQNFPLTVAIDCRGKNLFDRSV